jgi:hypothetical protein
LNLFHSNTLSFLPSYFWLVPNTREDPPANKLISGNLNLDSLY